MIIYFGERWDAPLFDAGESRQTPTPVGQPCLHCGEQIADGDLGFMRVVVATVGPSVLPAHRECDLRSVLGGLDHVLGRCEHTGHCNELREQAGRTLREDALGVWAWAHGDRR